MRLFAAAALVVALLSAADARAQVQGGAVGQCGAITVGNSVKWTSNGCVGDGGSVAASAVSGPASATSGDIATFNGITGKIIQDSGASATSAAATVKGSVAGGAMGDLTAGVVGSLLCVPQQQILVSGNNTYTTPTCNSQLPTNLTIEAWGGGASGGGGDNGTHRGTGGAGGGYGYKLINSSVAASYTANVGAAGTAVGITTPGIAGGTTTCGPITANGGGAGAAATGAAQGGSSGGTATGGDENISGESSTVNGDGTGNFLSTGGNAARGGMGGKANIASAGGAPGGGGAAANATGSSGAGAAGACKFVARWQ